MKWSPPALLGALFLSVSAVRAAPEPVIRSGERVLFLGDSVTMDGRFILWLDLLTRSRLPAPAPELINLGLASETVSGLSEAAHPWPRPCVLERLDRALEKVKPGLVVACYGMNDGIYAPFSEERAAAFLKGWETLSAKVRQSGARLVMVSPPPFDALSFSGALKDENAGDFSFMAAFRGYDGVLAEYGNRLKGRPDLADRFVDTHTPMSALLASMHAADPAWKSGDGIHPGAGPHAALAGVLASALGLPDSPGTVTVSAPGPDGAISVKVDTVPPLPTPGPGLRSLLDRAGFSAAANRLTLTIPNADQPVYRLKSGDRLLGIFSSGALARGVDLTALDSWEPVSAAVSVLPAAEARHRLLSGAWREHVGHTRPDTDRNFPPLDEALQKAAEYDAVIDAVMRRRETHTLTLEPLP